MVLASSIAVYDANAAGAVDEDTRLETRAKRREAYVGAKLAQEEALRASGLQGWCLRIGAIYDSTRRWNAHIGVKKGAVLISLARTGDVPLVQVADAAEAMICAAETAPNGACEALNIVESPLPSRKAFIAAEHHGLHIPLHWRLLLPLAWLCEAALAARAPGLLRPRILRARMTAVSYPNTRATARLGWHPQRQFLRGSK
jgi:nucleoside-diphosphate-sugar epimerase